METDQYDPVGSPERGRISEALRVHPRIWGSIKDLIRKVREDKKLSLEDDELFGELLEQDFIKREQVAELRRFVAIELDE
jgi:hypothetical protein